MFVEAAHANTGRTCTEWSLPPRDLNQDPCYYETLFKCYCYLIVELIIPFFLFLHKCGAHVLHSLTSFVWNVLVTVETHTLLVLHLFRGTSACLRLTCGLLITAWLWVCAVPRVLFCFLRNRSSAGHSKTRATTTEVHFLAQADKVWLKNSLQEKCVVVCETSCCCGLQNWAKLRIIINFFPPSSPGFCKLPDLERWRIQCRDLVVSWMFAGCLRP